MKNRNIITKRDTERLKVLKEKGDLAASKEIPKNPDDYLDRLMKYVPVEILGAYLICEGVLRSTVQNEIKIALLCLLLLGLVGTFFYVKIYLKVVRFMQVFMSILAFIVWVFSIGGWFGELGFWKAGYGTIAVIIYAVAVKIIKLPPLPDPGNE
jgi:hypothetical protein